MTWRRLTHHERCAICGKPEPAQVVPLASIETRDTVYRALLAELEEHRAAAPDGLIPDAWVSAALRRRLSEFTTPRRGSDGTLIWLIHEVISDDE